MQSNSARLSKFLSFVLRHKPDTIGLTLDPQGWTSIDELIAKSDAAGTRFSREDLLHVVATGEKKRFLCRLTVNAFAQRRGTHRGAREGLQVLPG
jgi:putative RNA 2'-phosphotransferase